MSGIARDAILLEMTLSLRRICEYETIEITPRTKLEDIPNIDSLRLLQAIAHLEDHFGVEIDTVALGELYRVGDVLDVVANAPGAGGT